MTASHVVVDGSNLATEGRSLPSLGQLDEAVRAYLEQYEPAKVTVVVDASFPNRIEEGERDAFEAAVDAGEIITPPAGVIGRGDAFLLEVADRADAVVLSNDSFQEFHGQFQWLFEQGRLVGGKPVPHVGWVFMDRAPVRGPVSRKAVSDAKKAKRGEPAPGRAAAPARSTKAAKAGKATKATKAGKAGKAGKAATKTTGVSARGSTGPTPAIEGTDAAAVGKPSRRTRRRRAAASGPAASAVSVEAELVPGSADRADAGDAGGDAAGAPAAGGRRRRRRKAAGAPGAATDGGIEPYNEPLPFIDFVAAHPVGTELQGTVERFSSHGAYVLAGGARCYLPLKHLADPPPRSAREVLDLGETYTFVVHSFDTPRRGVDLAIPGVVPVPAEAAAGAAGDPEHPPTEEERMARAKKAAARKGTAKKAAKKRAPAKKATAKKAAKRKAPAKKAAKKRAPARKATAKKAAKKRAPARKATAKKAAKKRAPAKKATAKKAAKKRAPAKKAAKRASRR